MEHLISSVLIWQGESSPMSRGLSGGFALPRMVFWHEETITSYPRLSSAGPKLNSAGMPLTLQLKKMSHADKLRAMEAIWNDLAGNEARFESPAWHGTALEDTQQLVKAGKAKFSDWEDAKARLRRKTAKVA